MPITLRISLTAIALLLIGCDNAQPVQQKEIIRGLKSTLIEKQENMSIRRYPSVLQPSETTVLSFQIAGQMEENNLLVGQKVKAGETLIKLNPQSLNIAVETAQAALVQAQAAEKNANSDFQRKEKLSKEGVISQTELENARTNATSNRAQAEQAAKQLANAQENLSKSELKAPYNGIINSISVRSFANVNAGTQIATLYNPNGFEARFSVSYDIASSITVGKPVTIRLADNPNIMLKGHVKELASSTNTVSSYPVIVALQNTHPDLKSGMAVEVSMEFEVTKGEGYLLPLTSLLIEDSKGFNQKQDRQEPFDATVFVYQPSTQTVVKKTINIGGIRGNKVIVIAGLNYGDRVAVAGVPFLREGQKVKLLAEKR